MKEIIIYDINEPLLTNKNIIGKYNDIDVKIITSPYLDHIPTPKEMIDFPKQIVKNPLISFEWENYSFSICAYYNNPSFICITKKHCITLNKKSYTSIIKPNIDIVKKENEYPGAEIKYNDDGIKIHYKCDNVERYYYEQALNPEEFSTYFEDIIRYYGFKISDIISIIDKVKELDNYEFDYCGNSEKAREFKPYNDLLKYIESKINRI